MALLTITTICSKGEPNNAHVALSKLLFNHMQTIGIAGGPDPLSGVFALLDAGSSVGTGLVSVDCLGFDSTGAFALSAGLGIQLSISLIALLVASAWWIGVLCYQWRPTSTSASPSPKLRRGTTPTHHYNPMRGLTVGAITKRPTVGD